MPLRFDSSFYLSALEGLNVAVCEHEGVVSTLEYDQSRQAGYSFIFGISVVRRKGVSVDDLRECLSERRAVRSVSEKSMPEDSAVRDPPSLWHVEYCLDLGALASQANDSLTLDDVRRARALEESFRESTGLYSRFLGAMSPSGKALRLRIEEEVLRCARDEFSFLEGVLIGRSRVRALGRA